VFQKVVVCRVVELNFHADTPVKVLAISATETIKMCRVLSHVRGEERELA
jgi:hypothetical protein